MEMNSTEVITGSIKPKTVFGILTETFRLYYRAFWEVIAIVFIALGGFGVLWVVALLPIYFLQERQLTGLVVSTVFIFSGFALTVWILMVAVVMFVVSERLHERQTGIRNAYAVVAKRLFAVLGAELRVILALLGLSITIIGIPFALYLAVRWDFIWQAAVLEGHQPGNSLRRSSTLVAGQWWRVLGIIIVMSILTIIIELFLSYTLGLVPVAGPLFVYIIVTPLIIIAHTVLYHDLRVRVVEV